MPVVARRECTPRPCARGQERSARLRDVSRRHRLLLSCTSALAKAIALIDPATMHDAEDHGHTDPTDPGHPTNQELSRRFVELRVAAGLDIPTWDTVGSQVVERLAKRADLDLDILLELEAGSRTWTLDEILAVTLGLDEMLPNVFAP